MPLLKLLQGSKLTLTQISWCWIHSMLLSWMCALWHLGCLSLSGDFILETFVSVTIHSSPLCALTFDSNGFHEYHIPVMVLILHAPPWSRFKNFKLRIYHLSCLLMDFRTSFIPMALNCLTADDKGRISSFLRVESCFRVFRACKIITGNDYLSFICFWK